MKVMILAAGRGERMRPLTDHTPKPLLKVGEHCLIEHHILRLKQAGYNEFIINTAWLAEKIHQQLGDGSALGVSIQYSDEGEALETGGGIKRALPLLGDNPFLVINGDVWCDYDFNNLPELKDELLAHLVLVNNPQHNPDGDFAINEGLLSNNNKEKFTFSGIGIYHPQMFNQPGKRFPLAPIFRQLADQKKISAEKFDGLWMDIGTPERLDELRLLITH